MTIRELLEVSPSCDTFEAVIRKNGCGQWLQGYRVGKDVRLYPSEQSREFIEMMSLNEYGTKSYKLSPNEVIKAVKIGNNLKMTIICKEPLKAPKEILDLEISYVQPRHIPMYHKSALTHNDFMYDIDCYPPDYQFEIVQTEQKTIPDKQLTGQTSIFDFIEEGGD